MPPRRYLHVRDLTPEPDGSFRLRDGYSLFVAPGVEPSVPIHSIVEFIGVGPTYKPLVVFWKGKNPYILDPDTGNISIGGVRGTVIQSSARFSYYYFNNHLHGFNGTDAKWFDGQFWRDVGLRKPTATEVINAHVGPGAQELSSAEAAAITLGTSGGGNFGPTTGGGYFVYVAVFDTSNDDLGPATISVSPGRVQVTTTAQEIVVASMPVLTGTQIKLIARTKDGLKLAYFCTNGTGTIVDSQRTGSVLTVHVASHGWSTGQVVALSGNGFDGLYAITVTDADHFNVNLVSASGSNSTGGTAKRILSVGAATTSVAILDIANLDENFVVNGDRGLAASVIGGSQPGYQFYAAIRNRVTGHVGNRTAIGGRLVLTEKRTVHITGLPTFASEDDEWELLLGRTGDGAEVPYAMLTADLVWVTVPSGVPIIYVDTLTTDGNSELPTRNFPPPGTLDWNEQVDGLPGPATPPITSTFSRVWVESDQCCGVIDGTPTIYRSGSALNARQGEFVGLPEQSWFPTDLETFPERPHPITSGHGYLGESWVYTKEDFGILLNLAGQLQWQGPFNQGCAGQNAWAKGWKSLPYWISGRKQLVTATGGDSEDGGAQVISDEYEAALLAKIGDAYLSETEVVYIRHPNKRVDHLRIKARDSSGNPFTIVHDFKLADPRSPWGQAYEEDFVDVLASNFTQAYVKDGDNVGQVFAGASNGRIYKLYSGAKDLATEFTGEALGLVYFGPDRKGISEIQWYGDELTKWFVQKDLRIAFDRTKMQNLTAEPPDRVPGDETGSHFMVKVTIPENIHAYILMRLTSHSADYVAPTFPPHIPLDTYGRIWLVSPQGLDSRPR